MTLGDLARRYAARRKRGGPRPSWADDVARPLAEALAAKFPARTLEIHGPGPSGAVCVCLVRRRPREGPRLSRRNCLSLTLVPLDPRTGATGRRDYRRRVRPYGGAGPLFAEPELGPGTTADDLDPLLEGDRDPGEGGPGRPGPGPPHPPEIIKRCATSTRPSSSATATCSTTTRPTRTRT